MPCGVGSSFCLQISVGGEVPSDTASAWASRFIIDASDDKKLHATVANVVNDLRIEQGWYPDDLFAAISGRLKSGDSVRLHIKGFHKLLERRDATRWKQGIEETTERGAQWSAEMPLRAYLEASGRPEWEQRLPREKRIYYYDLWPGSSGCPGNVSDWERRIAGCHAGVIQFVKKMEPRLRAMNNYDSLTPLEVVSLLGNGKDMTVFDRIWNDLDVSHQDMARKLVLNPQLPPPEGWRLGPFNFGQYVNGKWRWFSPLFRDYLYYYHTTRGAFLRITQLGKVYEGVVYLLRNAVRNFWQEHGTLARYITALVLFIVACVLSLLGHPWMVFLPLILGIMAIRPLLGRLCTLLYVPLVFFCTISLLPVTSYWFGERLSKMAAPPEGLWMVVVHPYWISSGDTVEINVRLGCTSHCPKSVGLRLRSLYPDVEFASGGSLGEKQLSSDEWGTDGQTHVPTVIRFAWQHPSAIRRQNSIDPDLTARCPLNNNGKMAQVPIEISISSSGQESSLHAHLVCLDIIPTTVPYVGLWIDQLPVLYAELLGMLRGTEEVPAPWALHQRFGGAIPMLVQAIIELFFAQFFKKVAAAVFGIRSS